MTEAGPTREPSGRSSIALVTRREIRERLRTKSFRWATAILVAAAVLGVALPKVLGGDTKATRVRVGVTEDVPTDVRQTISGIDPGGKGGGRTVVISYTTTKRGQAAVVDGKVSFLVTPDRLFTGKHVARDGTGAPARVFATTSEVLRLRSGLEGIGVGGIEAARALSAEPLPVQRLVATKDDTRHEDQIPLVAAVNVLMYVILIVYGQMVAAGVNEEKSSRVVELLLSAMSPRRLLTGKVAGIGFVGLVQVALMAVAAGATALIVRAHPPSGSPVTAAGYVVWFALAYALYCTLFAAAGSLTSRAEESQQAATPVILLLAIGYLAAFAALQEPDGAVVTVLSFVPFTAPWVMPARAAIGSVPLAAIAASMLLTVAAIVVTIRVAGRIYSGALLRFGPRVKVRDALRSGPPAHGRDDAPSAGRSQEVQPSGRSVG